MDTLSDTAGNDTILWTTCICLKDGVYSRQCSASRVKQEIQAAKCMESCITDCENAPLVTMFSMASCTTGWENSCATDVTLMAIATSPAALLKKKVHDL